MTTFGHRLSCANSYFKGWLLAKYDATSRLCWIHLAQYNPHVKIEEEMEQMAYISYFCQWFPYLQWPQKQKLLLPFCSNNSVKSVRARPNTSGQSSATSLAKQDIQKGMSTSEREKLSLLPIVQGSPNSGPLVNSISQIQPATCFCK